MGGMKGAFGCAAAILVALVAPATAAAERTWTSSPAPAALGTGGNSAFDLLGGGRSVSIGTSASALTPQTRLIVAAVDAGPGSPSVTTLDAGRVFYPNIDASEAGGVAAWYRSTDETVGIA